jgi:drug/metabolite transporter (DMT)-like permease
MDIDFKNPANFRILFIRNLCVTAQSITFTLSQFYLPQSIVQTINTTGYLFVFILDYKINHVTITKKQFYGVIFGVIGVIFTVNGDFVIKKIYPTFESRSDFKNYISDDPIIKLMIAAFCIIGNILWAYAQVITKKLHEVNAIQINVHLGYFLLFTAGVFYPTQVEHPVPVEKFLVGIIAGGVVMTIGQICFIGATTMTKNTGVLTMFGFVSVIEGYLVSVFKYN